MSKPISITKEDLMLMIVATAFGGEYLYLTPAQGADAFAAGKEIYGDLGKVMNTPEGKALTADPAVLPEAGSDLEQSLIQFTNRVQLAAVKLDFEPNPSDWNQTVTGLAAWLTPEDTAVAEIENEQAVTALTEEQTQAVVEAATEDVIAVEEAKEVVEQALGPVVAANMSDDQLVSTALSLGLAPAQAKAKTLTHEANEELKESVVTFLQSIQTVTAKLNGSVAIQEAIGNAITAALPAGEPVTA